MARRPYDRDAFSDDELVAIGGRSKAGGAGRLYGGLFVVAALTFAAGYYLPLHRTHEALLKDYAALSERTTATEKDLAQARTDLTAAAAHSAQLSADRTTADTADRERDAKLGSLQVTLKSKLPEHVGKGQLAVGTHEDRVVVTLRGALEQTKGHVDAAGIAPALCAVASVVDPSGFDIDVVAYGSGAVKATGDSEWDAAGKTAASVAEVIAAKCKFPGGRLRTTTRLAPASGDAEGRVDLDVEPRHSAAAH